MGLLGRAVAGPVFLHVGTTFVEPTVAGYEPTEGATTDPYPPVPLACASANVLVRVKAVVSTIVLSFMRCPSCCLDQGQPRRLSYRSLNSSLSAMEAAKLVSFSKAKMLPQSSSIACHSI